MNIGSKIRKIREARNYTQETLASKLGMSQNGYSRLEREDADISFSRLMQIAQALETSLFDLIDFEEGKVLFNQTSHDNSNGVVFQQSNGIAESERTLYEARIADLQKENERLHALLTKALTK